MSDIFREYKSGSLVEHGLSTEEIVKLHFFSGFKCKYTVNACSRELMKLRTNILNMEIYLEKDH